MRIEHIAVWADDIEKMRSFYSFYFEAASSEKYYNPHKEFTSYFLSFKSGARLELMNRPGLEKAHNSQIFGWAHLAISAGSRENVDKLTETLRADGYTVTSKPRITGDGYYESTVLDPEGNQLEITE